MSKSMAGVFDGSSIDGKQVGRDPLTVAAAVRNSAKRGDPFDEIDRVESTVKKVGLQFTLRPRARPMQYRSGIRWLVSAIIAVTRTRAARISPMVPGDGVKEGFIRVLSPSFLSWFERKDRQHR
jgi:hypothetical protein